MAEGPKGTYTPKHMRNASMTVPAVPADEHDCVREPGEEVASDKDGSAEQEARALESSNRVTLLVIVSRITGFFRTTAQAWALGAYGLASAYTVANNLPNTLYELVAGGMLITAFLPVYVNTRNKLGSKGSSRYASNLLSIVVLLMVILTFVSFLLAVPIVWTQSAGANADFDSSLAVWFFRWFAIEIVLYACSSIISGVLNAERDYLISNAAPVFNNVIVIASFVIFAWLVHRGVSWHTAAIALAIGNPLGVLVQVLVQIPALRRHGVMLTWHVNFHDPALRDTVRIGLPTLVVTLASTPTAAVTSTCALWVTAAGASIAYYARVWYVLPYSVFTIPISVTMFTELSDAFMRKDMRAYKAYFSDGASKILFTIIPFAMYLVVFSPCLIAVLTSGSFTTDAARLTTMYLRVLAISLPFYALSTYLQKVCASMMHMNFFAIATCVASAIQIVVCLYFTPIFGLSVVPASSILFYGLLDFVTLVNVRKILGQLGLRSVLGSCLRALAFGAAGSVVGLAIVQALVAFVGPCQGIVRGVAYAVAGGIPALLITFGISYLMGRSESTFFNALFDRCASLVGHRGRA